MYREAASGAKPLPDANTFCGLCGKTEADGPLTKTDCCDRTICDDESNYVRHFIVCV